MGKKNIIKTPLAEDQWKDAFRASSMKIGFNLNLTKTMLEYLCAVADDVQWDRSLFHQNVPYLDNWVASERALKKRGLIERKPKGWFDERKHDEHTPFCEMSMCVLTPAGSLVVELVKLAGIFVEADAAINKKARA